MKTSIKNLLSATLVLIALSTSAFAAPRKDEKGLTVLDQIQNISKIEVTGNVDVILVQSPDESVKVYDSYYAKNALVQQEQGTLRISSFQKETLTVAVYVRNLSAINASGNAKISTQGRISFLSLAVSLKDSAVANINANMVDLYTSIADQAGLTLAGSTIAHDAVLSAQAKLDMDQFKADYSALKASNPVIANVANKKAANVFPADEGVELLSK